MNDELMRRIEGALDAEGGLDGDADLRALLDEDGEALAYAQDLVRIDSVLKSFGERVREPDWEALAARIEARLDAPLASDGHPLDIDAPPFAEEAPARKTAPREPAVSQEVAVAPAAASMAASAERAPAPVVSLASRRTPGLFVMLGGLAAAAAVGLGITFGVTTLDEPAAEMASAPAMQEALPPPSAMPAMPAEAEPAWDGVAEEPAAPGEAELPAAAVAQPLAGARRMERPRTEPAAAARLPMRAARALGARADSLDDRTLGGPARGGAGGGSASSGAAPSSTPPSRAHVLTVLRSAEPSVQPCLADRGQLARVAIQVGADGSVVSVRVSPPYVGAQAACIVDALRGVRMPSSPTDYPIAYTFHPAPMAGGSLARPPAAARRRAAPPPAAPSTAAEVADPFAP